MKNSLSTVDTSVGNFNGVALVMAVHFHRKDADGVTKVNTNGMSSCLLRCIAGTIPNRNIIDGTVAQNMGIAYQGSEVVPKQLMLVNYTDKGMQTGKDGIEYRNFDFLVLATVETDSILDFVDRLGAPKVINVTEAKPKVNAGIEIPATPEKETPAPLKGAPTPEELAALVASRQATGQSGSADENDAS